MTAVAECAPRPQIATVDLLGVRFHALTEAQAIAHVLDALDLGRGGTVVTPNLDHLRRCVHHQEYREIVGRADLVVADGMPLIWASRIAGTPLPERVAGSNLVPNLSGAAASRGRSVFFLGGVEGTADGAARILRERHPSLRVAGTWYPAFGFEDRPDDMAKLEAAVIDSAPDIVYVGLGSPKQERLIERLRARLPHAWWMGVGISFSFVTGDVRRAPVWMRRTGLEWVHRLASEPRRLGRRYLAEGIPFGIRLLSWAAVRRLRG